jgi:hypothetical protein
LARSSNGWIDALRKDAKFTDGLFGQDAFEPGDATAAIRFRAVR